MLSRWLSKALSDQAVIVVLVAIGTTSKVIITQTIDRPPAYAASLGSIPSISSVRNTGGNSPRNRPHRAWIFTICSHGVKLSIDASHQTQPALPTTAVNSQTVRSDRR